MFQFSVPYPSTRSANFISLFPATDNASLYTNPINPRSVDRQRELMYSCIHALKKKTSAEDISLMDNTRLICETYIGYVDSFSNILRKTETRITIEESALEKNPKNGICKWTGSSSLQANQNTEIITESPFFCLAFEKVMACSVCIITAINIGEIYMKMGDYEKSSMYFATVLVYVAWAKAFIEKCTFVSKMPEMDVSVQNGLSYYASARGMYATYRHENATKQKTAYDLVAYYAFLCNMCTCAYEQINISGAITSVRGIALVAQFLRMEYLSRCHQYLSMHYMTYENVRDFLGKVDRDKIDYQRCYNLTIAAIFFAKKAEMIAENKNITSVKSFCKERISTMTTQLNTIELTIKHMHKSANLITEEIFQHNPFMYVNLIKAKNDSSLFESYVETTKHHIIHAYNK